MAVGAASAIVAVPERMPASSRFNDMHERISHGDVLIFKVAQAERTPLRLTLDVSIGTSERRRDALVPHFSLFVPQTNGFVPITLAVTQDGLPSIQPVHSVRTELVRRTN